MAAGREVVMFVSSVAGSIAVTKQADSIRLVLNNRVPFSEVDVSLPENADQKEAMATASGKKTLPQVHVRENGALTYIGGWDEISEANEVGIDELKRLLKAD